MLFANRRLANNAENEIREYLAAQSDIPASSICLGGLEQLKILLKTFPDVAVRTNLDPIDSPLIVSPDDLAEVVQALARQKDGVTTLLDEPPTARMTFKQKNILNNMSTDYAKAQRRRYLKETAQIRAFLAAPENLDLLHLYESVVDEFQLKIIAKRKDYQTFVYKIGEIPVAPQPVFILGI